MSAPIVYNGKRYQDADEMPEADRREYDRAVRKLAPFMTDADGNGIPDLLEGKGPAVTATTVTTTFFVNGRRYRSLQEVPAGLRGACEQALRETGAPGAGPATIGANPAPEPGPLAFAHGLDPIVRRALGAGFWVALTALAIWILARG